MMRADIYDQLKIRLFSGEIRPGQFLSQRELTALLGATLNPVREAIRKLEAEGLINVYAQRGIQVIEAEPKSINDAFEYRLLLETNAVRYFIAQARDEQVDAAIEAARRSLAVVRESPHDQAVRVKVLDDDYKFHRDMVEFQRNDIISRHYSLNAARLRLFRVNIGEPLRRLDVAAEEHLEILDACRARDADRAIEQLSRHIEISREHTLGLRPMRWDAPVPEKATHRQTPGRNV